MGGVYYFGKAIEAVSIKLRIGKFEVGENWQCQDCALNGILCADCKDSWVHELSQLEYSNEFERRLGVVGGASATIMGVMAFFGNASMGFWESGPLLQSLSSLQPSLSNPYKAYYNYTLLLLFLLASFIFWSAQLIGLFLGLLNPMATRHWRHMTASVWSGFFAFFWGIMMLAIYNPLGDLIFVFWPIMTGLVICGVSLCMDMTEGEGVIRLDEDCGEEKV